MESLKQPFIDVEKINAAANEAAEKAYISAIKSYYTDYNSPFIKMINDELKKQKFEYAMYLPDIIAQLNKGLKNEIDNIANEAIANSFVPMVSKVLMRVDKHQSMSEILKNIVGELYDRYNDAQSYDFEFSYEKHKNNDWLDCNLRTPEHSYEFTLHTCSIQKSNEKQKYQLLSLPYNSFKSNNRERTMKITRDDVTIEMPFESNILADPIMRIFCNIMLAGCEIDVDCSDFDEDMFLLDE